MSSSASLDLTLLPGARTLLEIHARELPQRDDLCGAFCGSLALRAAGLDVASASAGPDALPAGSGDASAIAGAGGRESLDQDAVALAAGSVVSALQDISILPHGEPGRRDYRLELPFVEDAAVSGTTASGLIEAIARLSGERLVAIPYAGPWTPGTLGGLFELVADLARPVTLLANLATRHLWGSHPRADQLLGYLLDGAAEGPAPDWDVGHFACVFGRVRGAGGCLYGVADTYPSLGARGVHLQPQERLAAAIDRRDMPAGGVLAVVHVQDALAVRAGAAALGMVEGVWDNGTVSPDRVASDGAARDDPTTRQDPARGEIPREHVVRESVTPNIAGSARGTPL